MEKRHTEIHSFTDSELPQLNTELKDLWDRISWINYVKVTDATATPTGGGNGELRLQDDGTYRTLWVYVVNTWYNIGQLTNHLKLLERSSDPEEPSEGEGIIWLSDGTGKGDDGDILIASKAGGTAKYTTLFDHSAGTNW